MCRQQTRSRADGTGAWNWGREPVGPKMTGYGTARILPSIPRARDLARVVTRLRRGARVEILAACSQLRSPNTMHPESYPRKRTKGSIALGLAVFLPVQIVLAQVPVQGAPSSVSATIAARTTGYEK